MSVKSETLNLIELIKSRPEAFFIPRTEDNYDLFLDLYQRVGYAPNTADETARWRDRSRDTWRMQDSILPASCTGGLDAEQVVSSWGTLPRARNVLYGHSVCMEKTVASAATLFAQSLYSIDQMERYPEFEYWAGSYANHSRFTSLFQRPNGWKIEGQLELEVVRLVRPKPAERGDHSQLAVEDVTNKHLECLSPLHLKWFVALREESPLLAHLHSFRAFALRDPLSGLLRCIAIAQTIPPEFTAANVFSWTWIFPADGVSFNPSLYSALRSVAELRSAGLQLALNRESDFTSNDLNEPTHPAFWALTPRSQMGALRRSFEEAFSSLLDRYCEDDLGDVLRRKELVKG